MWTEKQLRARARQELRAVRPVLRGFAVRMEAGDLWLDVEYALGKNGEHVNCLSVRLESIQPTAEAK